MNGRHVHTSFIHGLTLACYLIIVMFLLRMAAARMVEKPGTLATFGAGLSAIVT